MNQYKELLKNNIVVFGATISLACVMSAYIIANGFGHITTHNAISVTGTAERIVTSDTAKWTFTIARQTTPEGYGYTAKQLQDSAKIAVKYLSTHGLDETMITLQPLASNVICQSQNQVMYDSQGRQQCYGSFSYNLTQTVIVESDNVNLLKELSLNAPNAFTNLGIQTQTISVEFLYTKLAGIRAELLEEAAKNAKERASAIAKSTGNKIGSVQTASQGVFQVTQKNSTDVSDYGSYDTSTIEKKITALVRASFEVK